MSIGLRQVASSPVSEPLCLLLRRCSPTANGHTENHTQRIVNGRSTFFLATEAKVVFDSIRWPGYTLGEGFSVMQKLGIRSESDDVELEQWRRVSPFEQRKIYGQVSVDRISRHSDYWEKVYGALGMAEAVFGKRVRDELFGIIEARGKIYGAAATYAQMNPQFDNSDLPKEFETIMWTGWNSDGVDPIETKLGDLKNNLHASLARFMINEKRRHI